MNTAYLGLGSNLGDRAEMLRRAVRLLHRSDGVRLDEPGAVASLYETRPIGVAEPQPDFLNTAVRVQTTLASEELMHAALAIEASLGRIRKGQGEPRPIDLDLLLFNEVCLRTDALEIPHPRLHLRRFVLEPLAEIAPSFLHPVLGLRLADLRDKLLAQEPEQTVVKIAGSQWFRLDAPASSG